MVFAAKKLQPAVDQSRWGFQGRWCDRVLRTNSLNGRNLVPHLSFQVRARIGRGGDRAELLPDSFRKLIANLHNVPDSEGWCRPGRLTLLGYGQMIKIEFLQKHVGEA